MPLRSVSPPQHPRTRHNIVVLGLSVCTLLGAQCGDFFAGLGQFGLVLAHPFLDLRLDARGLIVTTLIAPRTRDQVVQHGLENDFVHAHDGDQKWHRIEQNLLHIRNDFHE